MAEDEKKITVTDYNWTGYQPNQMKKENIIRKLKEQGCRITKQRLMLLDIILEEDCSCCKEIYYKAAKQDHNIGTATVYRMVNTLEKMGAISRKNMYKVSDGVTACGDDCPDDCPNKYAATIEFDDGSTCRLTEKDWSRVLHEGLRSCGFITDQSIEKVNLHRT